MHRVLYYHIVLDHFILMKSTKKKKFPTQYFAADYRSHLLLFVTRINYVVHKSECFLIPPTAFLLPRLLKPSFSLVIWAFCTQWAVVVELMVLKKWSRKEIRTEHLAAGIPSALSRYDKSAKCNSPQIHHHPSKTGIDLDIT